MSQVWKVYADNLEEIIDTMTPSEFAKQPRILESMGGVARTLFASEFYQRLLPTPGGIVVLGVRWGADFLTLMRLRSLYESTNQLRPILGFDTFEGHVGTAPEDGDAEVVQPGFLGVTEGWPQILADLIKIESSLSDTPSKVTTGLIKGDARKTVPEFTELNPGFVVGGVLVDFDLYEPTYVALTALGPHMVPGTVLWFDELNASNYPGEGQAMKRWVAESGVHLEWWRPAWSPHEVLATVVAL